MIDSRLPMIDFHGMMKCHIILWDFFMQSFFQNMKPYYTDAPSKFNGIGKGRTYEWELSFQDPLLPKAITRLVPQPQRLVKLQSEMEATSQIGLEARSVIGDNLPSALVGVDVGMDRHRSRSCSCAHISYKTDIEVDSMSLEDVKAYTKHCRDGLFELLHHDGEGTGRYVRTFIFSS